MKQTMRELYGVGILFFYFFKWPYFLGFPFLYEKGLNDNFILNSLWFLSVFLILKDFSLFYKRSKNGKKP